MIIWTGWGILVIFAAIAGLFGAGMATAAFKLATHNTTFGPLVGGIAGGVVAAGIDFLLTRALDKGGRTLLDPQTGRTVVIKKSNSFFFIPMRAWTPLFLVIGVIASVLSFTGAGQNKELEAKYPGKKVFEAADRLIGSSSQGTSHGNSADAKKAAGAFSKTFVSLQKIAFTGGSKKNILTGGEFLTYCRKNKDGVIFLCHVPSMRSYKTEDVKSSLGELAWQCGQIGAKQITGLPTKAKLTVALRGIASYAILLEGPLSGKGAANFSADKEPLYALFDPALEGAPTVPAGTKAKPVAKPSRSVPSKAPAR